MAYPWRILSAPFSPLLTSSPLLASGLPCRPSSPPFPSRGRISPPSRSTNFCETAEGEIGEERGIYGRTSRGGASRPAAAVAGPNPPDAMHGVAPVLPPGARPHKGAESGGFSSLVALGCDLQSRDVDRGHYVHSFRAEQERQRERRLARRRLEEKEKDGRRLGKKRREGIGGERTEIFSLSTAQRELTLSCHEGTRTQLTHLFCVCCLKNGTQEKLNPIGHGVCSQRER